MSTVYVKICGLTNVADAHVAVDAGADLLGFIFYPKSARYVAPETVANIVAEMPKRATQPLHFVGVFVNESHARIAAIVKQAGLDFVQLHGDEPPAMVTQLTGCAYKVLRPADAESARAAAEQFAPLGMAEGPRWMVDAYDPHAYGGTGKKVDWHVARKLAQQYPGLLLAGGLTPANVANAVRIVQPWGVDVASGVERAPGQKDHRKVQQFIAAAKNLSNN